MNKSSVCTQAKSVLFTSPPSAHLQRDFPELRRELNDPYLPTGSKQWLHWILIMNQPARWNREREQTWACLCLSRISASFPLSWDTYWTSFKSLCAENAVSFRHHQCFISNFTTIACHTVICRLAAECHHDANYTLFLFHKQGSVRNEILMIWLLV